MREDVNKIDSLLDNLGYELLDSSAAFAELASDYQPVASPAPQLNSEDLDHFDTLSIKLPANCFSDSANKETNWKQILCQMESSLSNGIVWLFDQEGCEAVNEQTYQGLFNTAISNLKEQQPAKSYLEMLAEFDSWTGTPLDILSPYGDIDFGHNIYADNFEVNVPISIVSQNEDIIVKANIPWVKANQFQSMDPYPSQLNLKSVLSLLPVRVNSREVKVTFENGEFRLEVPRVDEAKSNQKHVL